MRKIVLPGANIEIPVIGFGCSSLTGSSHKIALEVLNTAFDSGVRHFDVARYYGYGEAEGILGAFAKSRRMQITITTKFGIEPPQRTPALRICLEMGRRFVRALPATRKFLQNRSKLVVRTGAFRVSQAQRSLETSLRKLGTNYIDFYLLHDYALDAESPEELIMFLERAVETGKIRYFGVGTRIDQVLRALKYQPKLGKVVQFQNCVLTRAIEKLPAPKNQRFVITHGSLGGSYRSMLSFLKTHRDTARDWSVKLGVECCQEEVLSALMLNFAVDANPNGLVLFSSRSPLRVRRNANHVLEPTVSVTQVSQFGQLVQQALPVIL